ncbi:MAG: NnrU family protein, partial [Alphaproteobacteria bacterium]
MTELVLAAVVFLFLHALSSTPIRALAVGAVGEMVYRGLFSALSIAAIVWLAHAYNTAPTGGILWAVGDWGRHVAAVLMALAAFFVVSGLTTPNPTSVGFEGALDSAE